MNKKLIALLTGLAVAGSGTALQAQQENRPRNDAEQRPGAAQPGAQRQQPNPAQREQELRRQQQQQQQGQQQQGEQSQVLRLSQVIGSSVENDEGKIVAFIRDVTIEPGSDQLQFAILSLSPLQVTAPDAQGANTRSNPADPNAQSRDALNERRAPTAQQDINRENQPRQSTLPGQQQDSTAVVRTADEAAQDAQGETGATAGVGRLVPVPWQALEQSQEKSRTSPLAALAMPTWKIKIDEQKLKTAPSFEAGRYGELEQGGMADKVYAHFEMQKPSGTAVGTPGQGVERGQQQQRQGERGRLDRPQQSGRRPGQPGTQEENPNRPNTPNRPE